jgi:D-alanine transfer protein
LDVREETPPQLGQLRSLGIASVLVALLLTGLSLSSDFIQRREAERFAFVQDGQRARGLSIQRAALGRPDVMMLFGSSELALSSPLRADRFFRTAPTGFTVATVAETGTPVLMTIQNLAALGDALRGERVAVFLTADMFTFPAETYPLDAKSVAAMRKNYSTLHAAAALFSPSLNAKTKQAIANRLQLVPEVTQGSALVTLAAKLLSDPTPAHRAAYAMIYPLGRFLTGALTMQDRIVVLEEWVRSPKPPRAPTHKSEMIDWNALRMRADSMARRRSTNNPYGYDDSLFAKFGTTSLRKIPGTRPDSLVRAGMRTAQGWRELDLLIDVLNQYGAKPLFILGPYKGPWEAIKGTSHAMRQEAYVAVQAHARQRGAQLLIFEEYDEDLYFLIDRSHPSPKAWAIYDEIIDEFYHDRLH